MSTATDSQLLCIHGLGVLLQNRIPWLEGQRQHVLEEFEIDALPPDFPTVQGEVRPYDETDVVRHLSPSAVRVTTSEHHLEVYQDGERFWLIDDRWGLVQMNLLKGQWRAWVLDKPSVDAVRCFEYTVLWPMSQLLKSRGLWLVPGISLTRNEKGLLILCSFNIESELVTLLRSGWRIIGQRWTALREEEGRIAMLRIPGQVERAANPRPGSSGFIQPGGWVDLTRQYNSTWKHHAFCNAVVVIEPGRRQTAALRPVPRRDALPTLRHHWPIAELHPAGKANTLLPTMVRSVEVYESQLSRQPLEWSRMLDHICSPVPVQTVGCSQVVSSTRLSA